ncbi:hypothetical protein ColTof4_11332 [Colletotrichum tofieldiae]|nr:hypothetical protein ColTof4_11332 [Colletotrichum tofieldiae]GKT86874.1 hypothetical protein Ct61P_04724 [Colletotrichum tofieldiae]
MLAGHSSEEPDIVSARRRKSQWSEHVLRLLEANRVMGSLRQFISSPERRYGDGARRNGLKALV